MNLLSKDAPLNVSIAKMQNVLKSVGCETTFSQEKHPLQNCYSVNVASVEAPNHIYANGKGVVSEASMASALGEYIERLQTNNVFIDFYLPNRKYYPDEIAFDFDGEYLNDELKTLYNPNNEMTAEDLVDYNSDYIDKVVALPFIRQSDKEKTYIPINVLSNLYVSNGLATGNTPQEAQVQALSEIYERYVKIEIIKNAYALPKFPDELVSSFSKLNTDIQTLRGMGYIIEVLDASLGGQFPVTAISLINPKESTLFVSFGAHPILEVSLERTMTELMQGRGLDNLDSFEVPTFDMSRVADSFNLESHFIDSNGKLGLGFLSTKKSFEYTPWDYRGEGSSEEYAYLINILDSIGKEMYLREYNYLGFYSCQMIIPGLSEIYPLEDMMYNNKNEGKRIRDMVLNFSDYDPEDILQEIEALEHALNVEKYIGVIFKKNFNMIDFKAQMYLLLGDFETAKELLDLTDDKDALIVAELIRMGDGELAWEEYSEALFNLFGKARVEKAVDVLNGNASLVDVTLHSDYKNILDMFDRLEEKKKLIKIRY
jgi:ribosomal protein S12 methylthiotransferase accessory factor